MPGEGIPGIDFVGPIQGRIGKGRGWTASAEEAAEGNLIAPALMDTSRNRAPDSQAYVAATLKGKRGKDGGGLDVEETLIAAPLSHGSNPNSNMAGRRREDDENLVAFYPTGGSQGGDTAEDGTTPPLKVGSGVGAPSGMAVAMNLRGREGGANPEEDELASIRAAEGGSSRSYVSFFTTQPDDAGVEQGAIKVTEIDTAPALDTVADARKSERGVRVVDSSAVRRLTPVECERLQALPDGWTAPTGKEPDSRRYAALGDAVTASVAEWIGRRIIDAERSDAPR